MTPKEKAKELVEKFYYYANLTERQAYQGRTEDYNAKQCALICVGEMIKELEGDWDDWMHEPKDKYWQEVKQEINKL